MQTCGDSKATVGCKVVCRRTSSVGMPPRARASPGWDWLDDHDEHGHRGGHKRDVPLTCCTPHPTPPGPCCMHPLQRDQQGGVVNKGGGLNTKIISSTGHHGMRQHHSECSLLLLLLLQLLLLVLPLCVATHDS